MSIAGLHGYLAGHLPDPQCRCPKAASRRRRVTWAIFCIVVLSMADLYCTLLYARTIGMNEANPLARFVMSYNSPWILGLWKSATVAGACLIFWLIRHKRITELAAWACMIVLGCLTTWWAVYVQELPKYTAALDHVADVEPHSWVQMTE